MKKRGKYLINDRYLRFLCIPVIGISVPLLIGMVTIELYTGAELVLSFAYFTLIAFVIWTGDFRIHEKIRQLNYFKKKPITRTVTISLLSIIYSISCGSALLLIWILPSRENLGIAPFIRFSFIISGLVILFTLLYEVLFLTKDIEEDEILIQHLDTERGTAELEALKNEIDPHFIANSLAALDEYIKSDPKLAQEYYTKLLTYYKIHLQYRGKELISLKEDIELGQAYFLLQKKRLGHRLMLEVNIERFDTERIQIPPGAIQTAIENAIKYSVINEKNNLVIRIIKNEKFIKIINQNPISGSPQKKTVSFGIGLSNLNARFMILADKQIEVERKPTEFILKLPIIT